MSAVIEDVEGLFSDVGQVQKELEKFDVTRVVDANEIYELLETHSFRTDRVQFVTTLLLSNLGLRNDFYEDIIDVTDDSEEDYLEDPHYTSSPEYNLLNDSVVLDLSVSDPPSAAGSLVHDSLRENVNSNTNSSTGYAEGLLSSVVDVYPSSNLLQSKSEDSSEVHEIELSLAEDASKPGNDIVAHNTEVESNNIKENSEPNSSLAISLPAYQNDDFMCDVNNNDPNNNTEYEVPVQTEDQQEHYNSAARENDDSGMEFEDQDDVRSKLLEEARLIHRIVPRQNLEQIYSYLEANLDRKNRVQMVMQEFLKMELAPEVCELVVSDNDSNSNIPCQQSNNVLEVEVLSEVQPCSSSSKMKTLKKDVIETNTCTEPEPSTSANSKVKRRASKTSVKTEPKCSAPKKLKVNPTKSQEKIIQIGQDKCSKSRPPIKKSFRKKQGTNDVLDQILPEVDSETKTLTFATNNKQFDIGEVSSTSTSSTCAKQNSMAENVEVGITSTTNLNKQTHTDTNNAVVMNICTSESSRLGDMDDDTFVPQHGVHAAVETLIPLPSTENVELIGMTSAGEGDVDQTDPLNQREVATNEIVLTQDQLKYKSMLMEMFPDADPQYVRERCQTVETEESLYAMVTKLLEGADYPRRKTPKDIPAEPQPGPSTSAPDEDRVKVQYETLVAILPNADPMYLQETCEKIGNDENAMKTFVTNALETRKYPTREDYLKRQEAIALQDKYTKQFAIEGFLEVIPDPFKYFLEEKKNDKKSCTHAMAYLKARYKKIRQTDLKSFFCHNNYNLTLTCQELDSFRGDLRKSKRSEYECRIETEVNIPFLQEVAFIENKKKIEDYLKEKADRKEIAFGEAKAKGDLLECGCCFDNEVMVEDMAACNEGHLFCKECVRKGAEVQIGNGKTTFPCLNDCVAEFSLKTLQGVLKPSVLSKMLQRKQLEEVKAAGIEELETCPFCDFASIPPRDDKVFRCLNPDCMRDSCRNCKEPSHIPLRCDEVEKADEIKVRTYIEDRMTQALIRTCWKCGKKFIKEDGCNKMTCTCGALMCYICRQPVKDYSHFNGQGGDAYQKCPLYSNNDDIHVNAVREEAKKAKKEMEDKIPELKLKHDPTQILPKERRSKHKFHGLHHRIIVNAGAGAGVHLMAGPYGLQRQQPAVEMAVRVMAGEINMPFLNHDHQQQAYMQELHERVEQARAQAHEVREQARIRAHEVRERARAQAHEVREHARARAHVVREQVHMGARRHAQNPNPVPNPNPNPNFNFNFNPNPNLNFNLHPNPNLNFNLNPNPNPNPNQGAGLGQVQNPVGNLIPPVPLQAGHAPRLTIRFPQRYSVMHVAAPLRPPGPQLPLAPPQPNPRPD